MTEDLVDRIVSADVIGKDQDVLGVAQGGTVNAMGYSIDLGVLLELFDEGEDLKG